MNKIIEEKNAELLVVREQLSFLSKTAAVVEVGTDPIAPYPDVQKTSIAASERPQEPDQFGRSAVRLTRHNPVHDRERFQESPPRETRATREPSPPNSRASPPRRQEHAVSSGRVHRAVEDDRSTMEGPAGHRSTAMRPPVQSAAARSTTTTAMHRSPQERQSFDRLQAPPPAPRELYEDQHDWEMQSRARERGVTHASERRAHQLIARSRSPSPPPAQASGASGFNKEELISNVVAEVMSALKVCCGNQSKLVS